MMVLNYLMSDEEMNRLVQAGIEGVHYTYRRKRLLSGSAGHPLPMKASTPGTCA
jgi:hypothetical protein